jgi:hypothetical protein
MGYLKQAFEDPRIMARILLDDSDGVPHKTDVYSVLGEIMSEWDWYPSEEYLRELYTLVQEIAESN